MSAGKHIMLYFGSFNPVHRAHIAIAEWVVEKGLADEVVLVVSPLNPLKEEDALAPELCRFEMAEIAAAESRYPDRILVSAIEMTLPKPSYTIDTLRFLKESFPHTRFSLLVGGDIPRQLSRWKDYREILDGYDIYVYPRPGQTIETAKYGPRMRVLEGAPQSDISATAAREAVGSGFDTSGMLSPGVRRYIDEHGLWRQTPETPNTL